MLIITAVKKQNIPLRTSRPHHPIATFAGKTSYVAVVGLSLTNETVFFSSLRIILHLSRTEASYGPALRFSTRIGDYERISRGKKELCGCSHCILTGNVVIF